MNILRYSKEDSQRFGLRIFRAKVDEIDARSITKQILDNNIDTAIIRISAGELSQLEKIEKTAMPFIMSDTLVYYKGALSEIGKKQLRYKNLEFVGYY